MERVLVIEDDPEIAAFEKAILERAGFEVKVATSGSSGLEAELLFKPAVVLLDV
jgi:DNA-binding response OmpR family regulator